VLAPVVGGGLPAERSRSAAKAAAHDASLAGGALHGAVLVVVVWRGRAVALLLGWSTGSTAAAVVMWSSCAGHHHVASAHPKSHKAFVCACVEPSVRTSIRPIIMCLSVQSIHPCPCVSALPSIHHPCMHPPIHPSTGGSVAAGYSLAGFGTGELRAARAGLLQAALSKLPANKVKHIPGLVRAGC
jgi:hypothetical protein